MSRPTSPASEANPDVARRAGLRTRLLISGSVPVLVFTLFALWMGWSLQHIRNQELGVKAAESVADLDQVRALQLHVAQVQQFLSDVSATRAQDGLDDGFKLAAEHRDAFVSGLKALDGHTEPATIAELRSRFDAYYQAGVTMAKAYVAGGPEQGNALMPAFDKASEALQKSLDPFAAGLAAQVSTSLGAASSSLQLVERLALAACLGMAVVVFASSVRTARRVAEPIEHARQVSRAISEGDLTTPVAIGGCREVAGLLDALGQMQARLAQIVGRIRATADDIHAASSEVAASNQDLSQRTEETAASLQQTASSMGQLSSNVQHSTDSASQADALSSAASSVAQRGGAVVSEVVSTMDEIHGASRRIADIISVIDGIAFQTNILALNAAVEAARAGEQGRGFAVVASEVRSLAQRSAEAAREIKTLIGSSVDRVEAGARLVKDAGATMGEIVDSVRRVTDMIGEISASAGHQTHGIGEVHGAITQLDQMTRQNAVMVEQSAASAQRLHDQAEALNGLVATFRTSMA